MKLQFNSRDWLLVNWEVLKDFVADETNELSVVAIAEHFKITNFEISLINYPEV